LALIAKGCAKPLVGIEKIATFAGSYQYGADTSTFWMITTGVPGCATPQPQLSATVKQAEEGSPLGN
jgi:hypothetical protein